MPEIRLTLPRPHPAQATILRESKRFNVLACGRRFGKTSLAVHRLVGPALAGKPAAYFAPTYKMLSPVWRELRGLLAPVIAGINKQERQFELVGGGVIDFWSLDVYDSVRGRKYAHAVVDEAAMVGPLEDAWFAAIRPTLTDFAGGADLWSTPKGRNFFWRAYCWGQDPAEPEWACWSFPTTANPHIDPAEVEAARRQLPERTYQQEYLAEFLEDSGGVFRGVAAAVDRGRSGPEPHDDDLGYVLGVDLARVEDFTVLAVVDSRGRQVYFERFNQISWGRQIGAIDRVAGLYSAPVVLDCTGVGDPIYEALVRRGLTVTPYHFSNASKSALIDHLALKIERGEVRLLDVPEQTNELLAYQYELTPARNVRMNAPEGMHDDTVIALALACWGLDGGRQSGGSWGADPLDDWRG